MKSNIFFVRVYVAISVMNFLEYSDMNKNPMRPSGRNRRRSLRKSIAESDGRITRKTVSTIMFLGHIDFWCEKTQQKSMKFRNVYENPKMGGITTKTYYNVHYSTIFGLEIASPIFHQPDKKEGSNRLPSRANIYILSPDFLRGVPRGSFTASPRDR